MISILGYWFSNLFDVIKTVMTDQTLGHYNKKLTHENQFEGSKR